MQNRYVGDVGDFGKYGLLRGLCLPADGGPALRLGVVWYLVPDEDHNQDGRHVEYLDGTPANAERFRRCDPDLYDALRAIVHDGPRSVGALRERGALTPDAAFYEESLHFDDLPAHTEDDREARLARREAWLRGALDATAGCDVVFLDPDNGLEVATPRHARGGSKYAYYDELAAYRQRGQSLVVYHHLGRTAPAQRQVEDRLAQVRARLDGADAIALLFLRGTLRAFFVVPSAAHRDLLPQRIDRFLGSPWAEHFRVITASAAPSLEPADAAADAPGPVENDAAEPTQPWLDRLGRRVSRAFGRLRRG